VEACAPVRLNGEGVNERDGVIARSDPALYEAKRAGRDRVVRGAQEQSA